ncbi:MAG: glycerophosphodiester phosphodiesterase family protein [Actinoplanes sp.]
MKRAIALIVSLSLSLFFLAAPARAEDPLSPVIIVSHATAAVDAPKNTLAGIRKSKELGAPWVEYDIRWTKTDGTASYSGWPVLSHDDDLAIATNCTGSIANTGLNATLACFANDYAPWKGDIRYANEKVPYGYDFLNVTRQEGLRPLFDVKVTPNRVQMDKLMYYVDMFSGMREELIYMGSAQNIATVKPWYPDLEYMLIEYPTQGTQRHPANILSLGIDHYALPWSHIDPVTIQSYHDRGVSMFVWTSDNPAYDTAENMQTLLDAGVDGIITNQPDIAVGLL